MEYVSALASHHHDTTTGKLKQTATSKGYRWLGLCLALTLISACGGSEQESSLLDPSSGQGTTSPTPLPLATPTPDPINASALQKPLLDVTENGTTFNASWDNANADHYRLLYWAGNTETPIAISLEGMSFQSDSLSSGQYTVLLEALDSNGNSLFSDPEYVEVP